MLSQELEVEDEGLHEAEKVHTKYIVFIPAKKTLRGDSCASDINIRNSYKIEWEVASDPAGSKCPSASIWLTRSTARLIGCLWRSTQLLTQFDQR